MNTGWVLKTSLSLSFFLYEMGIKAETYNRVP